MNRESFGVGGKQWLFEREFPTEEDRRIAGAGAKADAERDRARKRAFAAKAARLVAEVASALPGNAEYAHAKASAVLFELGRVSGTWKDGYPLEVLCYKILGELKQVPVSREAVARLLLWLQGESTRLSEEKEPLPNAQIVPLLQDCVEAQWSKFPWRLAGHGAAHCRAA